MTSHRWLTWVALLLVVVNAALSAQARPQIASLGECVLSSGARLPDCRLGYRVLGARAAREDNVVLVPTWLGGTSADWVSLLGPGRLIDTTRYQVMVVDALGDGVSSSPSNQNVRPFPAITIEDMVATQYRLATEVLGLKRLHAVVGVSMGGIQVFEWAAAHPEFVSRFVSIVGSPRMARYDRIWLRTQLRVIEAGARFGLPRDTVNRILAGINGLVGSTPRDVNRRPPSEADSLLAVEASNVAAGMALEDLAAQEQAMLAYDFYRRPGGDLATAGPRLKGRLLVIGSPDDHVVSIDPALSVARRLGSDTLVVRSACGHGVFECETPALGRAIRAFLDR